MPAWVATNGWLATRCEAARVVLNIGHTLRLFENDLTPTPATVLADVTEATYAGYVAASLVGQWGAAAFVVDGLYQSLTGPHTFAAPTAGSQLIYGWFINVGTTLQHIQRFNAPVTMSVGGPVLQLTLAFQDFARFILP